VVVLPASMWAMTPMFLRCSRVVFTTGTFVADS
jgi:hypothetical protein